MPLRLLEVRAPPHHAGAIAEMLSVPEVIDYWEVITPDGGSHHRALLPSEAVESVTDALAKRMEGHDGFRVVLLAVEATLPKVEKPERELDPETGKKTREKRAGRVSREELLQDMEVATQVTPVFLVTVVLSTLVAAVGLLRGDVAVIIGAMVIAPLLGPNVALSLAATLGDTGLARRALAANAAGAGLALFLAVLMGLGLTVDPLGPELAARTRVGLSDVVLALAAGSAGALAFTSGLPSAVIGVMVAVALLPPLVAMGLLLGSGLPGEALAAATLLATNVTCVNLAGVATFLVQRVSPRDWWEAERARKTTRIAIATWVSMLVALVLLIRFAWS